MYLSIEKNMTNELDSSKSYQILSVEILKILNLDRINRNMDSQTFLDKCVSEYQKLYESSCIIERSFKDSLHNIYGPEALDWKPLNDELDMENNEDI